MEINIQLNSSPSNEITHCYGLIEFASKPYMDHFHFAKHCNEISPNQSALPLRASIHKSIAYRQRYTNWTLRESRTLTVWQCRYMFCNSQSPNSTNSTNPKFPIKFKDRVLLSNDNPKRLHLRCLMRYDQVVLGELRNHKKHLIFMFCLDIFML